jgi:hypothetical protein
VSSIHTRTWRPKATTTSEERERRDGRGDVVKGRRTLRQGRQPCAPHSRAAQGGRGGYSRKSVVSSIHPPNRALATGGVRGVAWRECIACAHAERAPRGGAGMPSYVIVLARGSWSVHGVVLVGSGATKTQRGACAVRGELSEMRGVSVWCLRAQVSLQTARGRVACMWWVSLGVGVPDALTRAARGCVLLCGVDCGSIRVTYFTSS